MVFFPIAKVRLRLFITVVCSEADRVPLPTSKQNGGWTEASCSSLKLSFTITESGHQIQMMQIKTQLRADYDVFRKSWKNSKSSEVLYSGVHVIRWLISLSLSFFSPSPLSLPLPSSLPPFLYISLSPSVCVCTHMSVCMCVCVHILFEWSIFTTVSTLVNL